MLSLQRFLSNGAKFFNLLEASAEEARQSVHALVELLNAPEEKRSLDEFVLRRRQNKRIIGEITELLCSSFITPLEREDIEALSRALYRVPKTVEKFTERMLIAQPYVRADTFRRQAELLEQATDTVYEMVRQLGHHPQTEKITEQNERLHQLEGEADKVMVDLLRDLYSGRHEALHVIVLRDLFELLEKIIDRCRDAGNVVFQIVLKYA
jgi:uncharacterized protein